MIICRTVLGHGGGVEQRHGAWSLEVSGDGPTLPACVGAIPASGGVAYSYEAETG